MRASNSHSFSSVFAGFTRFAAQLREIGERRRVIHNLASMDDYMLRDIGLTRSDIDAATMASPLTDRTLVLAERARESRQDQRAMARETQAWGTLTPDTAGRGPDARRVA